MVVVALAAAADDVVAMAASDDGGGTCGRCGWRNANKKVTELNNIAGGNTSA